MSSSIASIVARRGSRRTRPENTALSPMSSSMTNAGRWEICSAWNFAVVSRSRAAIPGDSARARSFFDQLSPSSPSFALFSGGKCVHFVPRYKIEATDAAGVAKDIKAAFEAHCAVSTRS